MRISLLDRVTAGVHQVGLAEAHAAIEVKWVVSLSRSFSDCQRSSMRKLIAGTDYKTVKGVL